MATAMAKAPGVATKTEQTFRRGRHLFFAAVALAHGPLTNITPVVVLSMVHANVWTTEISTINHLLQLCFAAFVAWLAFAVFDTHAEVTILPKRWRDLGIPFLVCCAALEVYSAVVVWLFPAEHLPDIDGHLAAFTEFGEVRFGWLVAALLAAAVAEELVYRALLLRALEGYMTPTRALVLQAAVFELVHVYAYGYGFSGVWFVGGVVLGYAFQRTRSIAAPTLLHVAHNILFFTLVWHFNQ
jgi:membrane protease YdiL (CAAX protease family)